MHHFTLTLSLFLSILVLTVVLSSSAQTGDTLPAEITCVPGTTVFLQGSGEVGTALLVQFNDIYVGGGTVKPGGVYVIPLNIDPATRAGEYPVTVEVRGTRDIIAETTCIVPGPVEAATRTPDPGSGSNDNDIPTDEADLDAEPSLTATPTRTPTRTPTPGSTATPSSTSDQSEAIEITIVRSPGRVNHGNTARLEIRAAPMTRCSIQVFYPDSPDGEPLVDGLQDKTTDQNGDVSWEWLVKDTIATGTHEVTVTCGDQIAETSITVLE